jgi:hypothetical protein
VKTLIRKRLAAPTFGFILFLVAAVAWAVPTTGTYNFSYARTAHDTYTVTITSTFNKTADCTVTWTGSDVNGNASNGTRTYVVPAYPGRGAAEVVRVNFNLSSMNAQAICQPRN